MNDLIRRKAAIEALGTPHGILYPIRTVEQLPSAQPERKKGKWLHDKDDTLLSGYCSCCGWESIITETDVADMPYCPNCGADMRGEEHG